MMNAKELARQLERIEDRGTLKQQMSALRTVLQTVERFVSEVAAEEKLADSVNQLQRQKRKMDGSDSDDQINQDIDQALAAATEAKRHIQSKKSALREIARDVSSIHSAIKKLV